MKALITVLVVTYNHRNLLARCLDSILGQKTDFPFQVLIVDDASTDGTSSIVLEYESRYDNVRAIIRPSNLGVARNIGDAYGEIDTDYFIITEGDDYWTDDKKLQIQLAALNSHPECIFCAHKTVVTSVDGVRAGCIGPDIDAPEKVFSFRRAPFCHTSSRLYRNFLRKLSDSDRHFIWRDTYIHYVALDMGPMVYMNREMSVYNQTGNGIWTSQGLEKQEESSRVEAFIVDQHLKFRHTYELRKRYLPESPRRVFALTFPFGKKWEIRMSMDRLPVRRCTETRT